MLAFHKHPLNHIKLKLLKNSRHSQIQKTLCLLTLTRRKLAGVTSRNDIMKHTAELLSRLRITRPTQNKTLLTIKN